MPCYYDILEKKHIARDRVCELSQSIKDEGRTIAFTNGCFDILHPGHLDLLFYCKTLADILILGINTDESIRSLKGNERPVFNLQHRMLMLAGYSFVDYLISFAEDTPYSLIKSIRPDFLIKGTDWGHGRIVGEDFVKAYKGNVIAYPLKDNYSSSGIIDSILTRFDAFAKNQNIGTAKQKAPEARRANTDD